MQIYKHCHSGTYFTLACSHTATWPYQPVRHGMLQQQHSQQQLASASPFCGQDLDFLCNAGSSCKSTCNNTNTCKRLQPGRVQNVAAANPSVSMTSMLCALLQHGASQPMSIPDCNIQEVQKSRSSSSSWKACLNLQPGCCLLPSKAWQQPPIRPMGGLLWPSPPPLLLDR